MSVAVVAALVDSMPAECLLSASERERDVDGQNGCNMSEPGVFAGYLYSCELQALESLCYYAALDQMYHVVLPPILASSERALHALLTRGYRLFYNVNNGHVAAAWSDYVPMASGPDRELWCPVTIASLSAPRPLCDDGRCCSW